MRTVMRAGHRCPVSIPLFCHRCVCGDHSRAHTRIGCTMPVMLPPYDFVCRCEETQEVIFVNVEVQNAVA